MAEKTKIGIILCDYHCERCTGIKCFRALNNREGAFSDYKDKDLELVAYGSCGGCPGSHLGDRVLDVFKENGVEVVFLSSGFTCGYPPCPHIAWIKNFIEKFYGMKVVVGTHPIPTTFWERHQAAGSWDSEEWQEWIKPTVTNEKTRESYIT